jgi:hypothetical protein
MNMLGVPKYTVNTVSDRSDGCATMQSGSFEAEDTRHDLKACIKTKQVCGRWARPMVRRQRLPNSPLRGLYPSLSTKGSLVFRLPPYNPSGERMAAISWNPRSFCFAIFSFHFLLDFLGLA